MLPMRPGEVASLRVEHLKVSQRALEIPTGKVESRIIPLTDAAVAYCKACAKGKTPAAWLVAHADGSQWVKARWDLELTARIAFGVTHQQARVFGIDGRVRAAPVRGGCTSAASPSRMPALRISVTRSHRP